MAEGAGWYADPSGKIDTFRWWDGAVWTRWLSADPAAPSPGPVPTPTPPPDAEGTVNPPDPAAYAPPDPADRVVRLPVAAAILVGALLLALIAVGAIITITADRPLSGPPVAPPIPSPPTPRLPSVVYDTSTRTVAFEEFRVVLAGTPFTCDPEPTKTFELFTSTVQCFAPVHDYAGDQTWAAAIGVGLLETDRPPEPDLRQLLASTASTLLNRNYDLDAVKVKKVKNRDFPDLAPDGRARVVTAELHLAIKGLPTDYDAVQVTVVRLRSGQYVAWWAFRPNDSPPSIGRALRASAETLTARK